MNIDCVWIEKNMEGLFCGTLSDDESRAARTHIESCAKCRLEVAALNAIDPLVKKYFNQQMRAAQTPVARRTRMSVIYGTAAAAIAATLVVAVTLRTPEVNVVNNAPPPGFSPVVSPAPVEVPPPVRSTNEEKISRTKPEDAAPAVDSVRSGVPAAVDRNAPDFVIVDPAGYSRTIEDYRGLIMLIGVWNPEQTEAVRNLEQLYRDFASNTKLRFVGVANQRQARAEDTTFPIFYNQGSRLFGAQSGDFVLIDERGAIVLRGSLVTDFDKISRQLRELR